MQAANKIEEPLAPLAQEEMMVIACSRLIVRLHPRDVDMPHLSLADQLLQGPVNRCDADPFHRLPGLLTNLCRGKRPLR